MTSPSKSTVRLGAGISALVVIGSACAVSAADAAPVSAKGGNPPSGTWVTPKEKDMKLEVCSPYLGGQKSLVGYYHGVKTIPVAAFTNGVISGDVPFNKIKAGKTAELEYTVVDSTNNCVVGDGGYVPAAPSLIPVAMTQIFEIDCVTYADKPVLPIEVSAPVFEAKERHSKVTWSVPAGKGLCFEAVTATVSGAAPVHGVIAPTIIAARFKTS